MTYLVIFIVIVLILVAVVAAKNGLLSASGAGDGEELRYVARPELFSVAERSFLGVLEQALAGC